MIIKLNNYNNFCKDNLNYNDDVRLFVTELLQTNSTGRIKYKISTLENFNAHRRHDYFNHSKNNKTYLRPQENKKVQFYSKYNGLGPLEFSLAMYLLDKHLEYNVIILTGALGSGKSTLCEYVFDYLKKSSLNESDILFFPQNGIIRTVNFNEISDSSTKEQTVNAFRILLELKMIELVENIHRTELFVDKFIELIQLRKDERYSIFSEFVRKVTNENFITEAEKFNFLLDWLEKFDDNKPFKLRLISYLLAYAKDCRKTSTTVDFIMLFDNIDKLNDDVQLEVLNIIFSFSDKLPIKILVPMRLTTFGKVRGNGSYSFAVFPNTGHPPSSILKDRIKHFLDHKDEYRVAEKVTEDNAKILAQNIEYIYDSFNDKPEHSRINSFYSAISGNSIRRGLFLAERFFLNSTVYYHHQHSKEFKQTDFVRALLISDNDTGKMSNADKLVNNLFVDQTSNEVSILKIRILQILSYTKKQNLVCTMGGLLSQIALFEDYSNEQVLSAVNDLIQFKKRLIYVEGVVYYSDFKNLTQSMTDVLHITFSGQEYLDVLLYKPEYLQNCFISVNWIVPKTLKNLDYLGGYIYDIYNKNKSDIVYFLYDSLQVRKTQINGFIFPEYHYGDIKERMKLLRDCLFFLFIYDLNQLVIYYETDNVSDTYSIDDRYIKDSIFVDIIAKVSISILQILVANDSEGNKDEIERWYDLLIIVNLWCESVFKEKNSLIENSKVEYRQYLGLEYKQ